MKRRNALIEPNLGVSMTEKENLPASPDPEKTGETPEQQAEGKPKPKNPRETGGPAGLNPTRYGDWERKGILSDF